MHAETSCRTLQPADIIPLANLWHDAWHETQAPFVPETLIKLRTLRNFEDRIADMGNRVRVTGPVGAPTGFCALKPNQLDQLFVAPKARGTGVAAALLADAEQRLVAQGSTFAVLDCLIENRPARRFYSGHGWVETGVDTVQLDTSEGPYALPCVIFRKEFLPDGT